MSIKDYTEEQRQEVAMIEVAGELLKQEKKPVDYHTLLKQVGDVKGMADEQLTSRISHLYTEMSMDGRFVNLGDNRWGLRSWYPFDQTEEELSQTATKERKKKAKEKEDRDDTFEDETDDFDEFEDLEDELDELANEEDSDFEDLDENDEFSDELDENEADEEHESDEEN